MSSKIKPTKQEYNLYKRIMKNGDVNYYARFRTADGWTSGVNTKCTSESMAVAWCEREMANRKGVVIFSDFTNNFFSLDSAYVDEIRITGKRMSERFLRTRESLLRKHLIPHFGNFKLKDISRQSVREVRNHLLTKKELSNSTVNHILQTLKCILDHADYMGLLQEPIKIDKVANVWKERGTFTQEEVQKLMKIEWLNDKVKLMCKVMFLTGIRVGECLALIKSDIHSNYITITKNYDNNGREMINSTKSGKERIVPIPSVLAVELINSSDYDCIFHGRNEATPLVNKVIRESFFDALRKIGITDKIRTERNLVIHSIRHYANSMLVNSGINETVVRSIIGHTSSKMTERYFHQIEVDQTVIELQKKMMS